MGCKNTFWSIITIFIGLRLANSLPAIRHARQSLYVEEETSDSSDEGSELRPDSREDLYNGDTQLVAGGIISQSGHENPELGPYFEGDILTDPNGRNGIPEEQYRWINGILKFYIDRDFDATQKKLIYDAQKEISKYTCVIFEEMAEDDVNADHVFYKKTRNYCSSYIGRRGAKQPVNLADWCLSIGHGSVVHETLHALGFYHEHTREDRDKYVKIHEENIKSGALPNFEINPSNTFGVEYDYGSIMHYQKDAFAMSAGAITIEVLQAGAEIGQRLKISPKDAKKVNLMYAIECETRKFRASITLWTGANCKGKMFASWVSVPNLKSQDKYSSVQVAGAWMVYEHNNYGYGMVDALSSSKYTCKPLQNISIVSGHVGSFQYAGNEHDFRTETLTIYQGEFFGGTGKTFRANEDFTNIDHTGSLVVTGVIPWQVFDSVQLTGDSRCIVPSPVPGEIAPAVFMDSTRGFGIPFNIRSVKLGCVENSYEDT